MAFIPPDAEWYIAEIVQAHKIKYQRRNMVYINWILVQADSPEDAYAKALALGKESESSFVSVKGKQVTVMFEGLRNLYVVYDKLEHGAELTYERRMDLSQTEIADLVRPKEALSIFIKTRREPDFDHMPLDLAIQLDKDIRKRLNLYD